MMWRDIITLIHTESAVSDAGDVIDTEVTRDVFANRKSVRQSEFYQAMATGIKPTAMFEIRTEEFDGAEKLRYNGKTYRISRVYEKIEVTELVCEGLVNEHGNA